MICDSLANKRVTVMGLGRFGGGLGAVRFCAERGARVLLTDLLPESELAPSLAALEDLIESRRVTLHLGGHEERHFTEADLVVANPAVPRPWRNDYLEAARRAGVPVTTEIGLATELPPDQARVAALTGTAGKSTTTAMLGHVLREVLGEERLHVGGNIGGSLLDHEFQRDDAVVLELSSAQLYWLGRAAEHGLHPPFAPRVAVVTTFAPNHLDWHETEAHYRDSKAQIHAHQSADDVAVLAEVDSEWERLTGAAQVVRPDFEALSAQVRAAMTLPGAHNARNAITAGVAAAALLGEATQHSAAELAQTAATFPGLPHRLRLVFDRNGRRAYDDSKSTTPTSTRLAVDAFDDPQRLHLILGGYDKKIDLGELIETARGCGGAYPIGAVGPVLAKSLGVDDCIRLEHAVERAAAAMQEGDILLLSPGCASWDQFQNYEERGERFAELVGAALA